LPTNGRPTSKKTFEDGSKFKIEIPSVENPEMLETVIAASKGHGVQVSRVSQGSGIMMLKSDEILRMLELGTQNSIEICLFVGPRAEWDIGSESNSPAGHAISATLRGSNPLIHSLKEIIFACNLGLRCILVADLGLLKAIQLLKQSGDLPLGLKIKTSAMMPSSNPGTIKMLEDFGATSVNVAVDLTIQDLSDLRQTIDANLDLYIEAPDSLGGVLRYYDIPEIVRVASPVFLKFGLRNSPSFYPYGLQLRTVALAATEEKVRRAAIGLEIYHRFSREANG